MKKTMLLAALAVAPILGACGDDGDAEETVGESAGYWFVGRVYDGASGARLTDYEIEVQYADRTLRGEVQGDGRFLVGPVEPMHDYSVAIVADGYRSFLSHNEGLPIEFHTNPITGALEPVDVTISFYYDAWLFPETLTAPTTNFFVTTANAAVEAAGQIRLTPIGSSSLVEARAGVPGQVWQNDEDLQFGSVTRSFGEGVATIEAGSLTYGVQYQVTVLGVDGFQAANTSFTAGLDGDQSITLVPFDRTPLQVVYHSALDGRPIADGELVIVFNQPIELDPSVTAATVAEHIDDLFMMETADTDGDGVVNTFHLDESDQAQEKGTSMTIEGNVLTFSWDRENAFQVEDPDDLVSAVHWNGLDAIVLGPEGGSAAERANLALLLGVNSVRVSLVAF